MALVTVMSAKGAPGATTASLLLANLWPRPTLVVDADPLGGDVALRLPGEYGPLNPDRGLMSLLPAARRGLSPAMVLDHAQPARGGQPVVPGLPGPEQAVAVAPLWPALADAFAGVVDHDVVVDVGQIHSRSPHLALVERSDALLCVYRATAWSVLHTRRRLESLQGLLQSRRTYVGAVCVGDPNEPAAAREATHGLLAGLDWAHDLGTIALDRKAVAMYEGGVVYRPERTLLVRSAYAVVRRLHDGLAATAVDPAADGDLQPAEAVEQYAEAPAFEESFVTAEQWAAERESSRRRGRRTRRREGRHA